MLHRGRRQLLALTIALLLTAPVLAASGGTETAFGGSAVPVAQRGDRSTTVATTQRLLQNAGVTVPGGVDGIYGPGTTSAVAEYQRRRGLPATGVLDVGTATLLGVLPATPLLARGASGAAVAQLQQRLLAAGIRVPGGADGRFGPLTQAALQQFQSSRGIPSTGSLDAGTEAVLAAAAGATTPSTPPTVPPGTTGDLREGSRGAAVVTLQQQLIAVGLRPAGGADGWFGANTAASVRAFQTRSGLPATGVADGATRTALAAASAPPTPPTPPGTPQPPVPSGPGLPLAAFPLPKGCSYTDTFGAPRSGGRTHEGVDMMAPRGTPIYAVQYGTITKVWQTYTGSLAGNAIKLTAGDGTYFFYAHLDGFVAGVGVGSVVTPGTIIGYVGSTGNAGTPHLHLEVHPGGGAAVNPFPIVNAAGSCH